MRKIVCDASSVISLAENCFLPLLQDLKNAEFIVSKCVEKEIVEKPLATRRFGLEAVRAGLLVEKGIIKVVDDPFIQEYTKKITDLANSLLKYKEGYVKIMHEGEAQSIACLKFLGAKTLLIDERTTRLLIEDIELLKKYIESRTGFKLEIDENVLCQIKKESAEINVIRSCEILAYAYENNLLKDFGDKVFETGLWALKFSGCSITDEEIKEYLDLLGQ